MTSQYRQSTIAAAYLSGSVQQGFGVGSATQKPLIRWRYYSSPKSMAPRNLARYDFLGAEKPRYEQHVFASYSHADKAIVEPIVRLIRATGPSVFMDKDSIPAGKQWHPIISSSIDKADVVLVFWCQHAESSNAVREEWERALQLSTDTVPVLMDNTDLPPALSEYQWVDLRPCVRHPGSASTGMTEGASAEPSETPIHEVTASAGTLLLMALRERHWNQQGVVVARYLGRAFANMRDLWVTYRYVSELRRSLLSAIDSSGQSNREHEASSELLDRAVALVSMHCRNLLSFFEERQRVSGRRDWRSETDGLFHFLNHRFCLYTADEGQDQGCARSRLDSTYVAQFVECVSSMADRGLRDALLDTVETRKTELVDQIVRFEHVTGDIEASLLTHIENVLAKQVEYLTCRDDTRLIQDNSRLIDMCTELLKIAQVKPHRDKSCF